MTIWKSVRPLLVTLKRRLLNSPPGLKKLGKRVRVRRPWRFEGSGYISIGDRADIMSHSSICALDRYDRFRFSPSISVGNDVYVGRHCFLTAIDSISIGDGCVLSEHVYITDCFHGFSPDAGLIMTQPLTSRGPVKIGANCFLGYRVAVMPNVTLGDWCIVGANSVVTHSFPAYSMIAGSPARLIKVYSPELKDWVAVNKKNETGVSH